MLEIQKYLLTHTFGQLAEEHGIYVSVPRKNSYKFGLNYSMIEAKDNDLIAKECRGIILTSISLTEPLNKLAKLVNNKLSFNDICPGETKIISYGMNRFFNYGQDACAKINWNDPSLKVMEKVDGTLCVLHYDDIANEWHVATRGVPEADVFLDNGIYTFRTLFEQACRETTGKSFKNFTDQLDVNITYCFELTSPFNRIVVQYNDCKITLLAWRDMKTLKEININTINIGVPHVHTYTINNIENILKWVSEQNPLQHEGVVVCDGDFNRIKIKNINYVMLNRVKDTVCNDRDFLGLIIQEKIDDVWSVLPDLFKDRILSIQENYKNMLVKNDKEFINLSLKAKQNLENPNKEFAFLVKNTNLWEAPLFAMFRGKATSTHNYILSNKTINGDFSNGFLDKLLSHI